MNSAELTPKGKIGKATLLNHVDKIHKAARYFWGETQLDVLWDYSCLYTQG